MDLFRRFGVLAAAGDRHLAEFMSRPWYLGDRDAAERWLFHLTSVAYRKKDCAEKIAASMRLASGEMQPHVVHSDEEIVELMRALLGLIPPTVSNANVINVGQMPDMPLGSVTETNCVFSCNSLKPVAAKRLPGEVNALVLRNAVNIENLCRGIRARDMRVIFEAFVNQPLCDGLPVSQAKALFSKMTAATEPYLTAYYPSLSL